MPVRVRPRAQPTHYVDPAHLWSARPTLDDVLPASIFEYEVELGFEGFGGDVRLATYLPTSDERQTVIAENFELGVLAFDDQTTPGVKTKGVSLLAEVWWESFENSDEVRFSNDRLEAFVGIRKEF